MAIQWMDDFGSYGNTESYMLNGLYAALETGNASFDLVTDPDVGATNIVGRFTDGTDNDYCVGPRKVLSSTVTTAGAAARFWPASLPATNNAYPVFFSFRTNANARIVDVGILSTGAIVARNFVTGVFHETTGPVMVANGWQHVEVKVVINSVVGSIEIRVEGVTVLNVTGIDTGTNGVAQVAFAGERNLTQGFPTFYFKDFVLWDGTGSYNNDFLGSVSVVALTPDSDNSFNWAASTGSVGYVLIDESTPNDADYISAINPPPAASTFGLSNLPPDVTSVKGLMTLVRARKTDGGDGNLQASLVSNSVGATGANRPITTAYTYWYDIHEIDPNTTAPWTPVAVDAALLKLNRTV